MAKVKYGLKNVHYAKITEGENGAITYGTPVHWPGAVSMSLDAEGELTPFRADNMNYWVASSNNGYSGELETALIPDSFRKDILGEVEDTNGVLVEYADAKPSSFALMFQVENDVDATRFCYYNCTATRPSSEANTTEETIEPQTDTISFTASPTPDSLVKATADASDSPYATWFETVYIPTRTTQGSNAGATQGSNTGTPQ